MNPNMLTTELTTNELIVTETVSPNEVWEVHFPLHWADPLVILLNHDGNKRKWVVEDYFEATDMGECLYKLRTEGSYTLMVWLHSLYLGELNPW